MQHRLTSVIQEETPICEQNTVRLRLCKRSGRPTFKNATKHDATSILGKGQPDGLEVTRKDIFD